MKNSIMLVSLNEKKNKEKKLLLANTKMNLHIKHVVESVRINI